MRTDPWIVIPNWGKFQHYGDRQPTWIKLYTELNSKAEWLELSYADRGLLVTIWIEYARSRANVKRSELPHFVTEDRTYEARRAYVRRALERLSHAGFVQFSASKPLAPVLAQKKKYLRTSSKSVLASEPNRNGSRSHAEEEKKTMAKTTPYGAAESMTRNVGWQYSLDGFRDELRHFDLTDEERDQLEALREQLVEADADAW